MVLSEISFDDQVEIFKNSKVVVGAIGAGLATLGTLGYQGYKLFTGKDRSDEDFFR